MLTSDLLADLIMWVRDCSSRRNVSIELGDPANNESEKIFVYDYNLGEGKHIKTTEELKTLDLKQMKKERMFAEYNKYINEEN